MARDRKITIGSVWGWCLDLVYPIYCLGCKREGVAFCDDCGARLASHPGALDVEPIEGSEEALKVLVGYDYGDPLVERMVHDLKYKGVTDLGAILGRLLAQRIASRFDELRESSAGEGIAEGKEWLVVPIPLHRDRERERGFNQSALIGRALADGLGVGYAPELLVRSRMTAAQAKLSRQERLKNVLDAFEVSGVGRSLAGKKILLVDDVCTTGATLQSAARVLRLAGCGQVSAAVFAHHLAEGQSLIDNFTHSSNLE